MREKQVLSSVIKDRRAYDAIADHMAHEDLSEQGWVVWSGVVKYYERDGSISCVDPALLGEEIARKLPADKHKDMFRSLVRGLADAEVSPANVVNDFIATRREVVGKQLAAALLSGDSSAGELLRRYDELLVTTELDDERSEEPRVGMSVESLVTEKFDPANLVQVMPQALNDRLKGGCKPGHHIVLFARPEMGKTMMTIEMMSGFLNQGLTVLYVGNEDPLDDVNMRVVNRLSGMTKEEVLKNPKLADQRARERGYESLILVGLAPGTPREITGLIERYKPHVLVLDQLRNLNMSQDNRVLALEAAACQARQWAKRYSCVVVSVTQAGDSASRKAVLDLGDVDYSNTGIPAQADLMIGLGANDQHAKNGELVISLPKNKISGCHEYFAVSVEPHLSKIMSI